MVRGVDLTARSSPARRSRESAWIELTAATAAVTLTAVAGAFLHFHSGPNAIDRVGFMLLPSSPNSSFFRVVTWFGTAAALVFGSLSAAIAAWCSPSRRRIQTLACLLGPACAAIVNQFLIKPKVGRLYVGELSFASGSVIVIAGVSAAWILAAPDRLRPIVIALGSLGIGLMTIAVVVLRWHYPSDALVGALFAVGMVGMVDGIARLFVSRHAGQTTNGSSAPKSTGRGTSSDAPNGSRDGDRRSALRSG